MKTVYFLAELDVDNRFTLQEIKFHLRRALSQYINELEDDDEDGIQLGEVELVDVDPRKVLGGNTQG
jgi:hypothetical protein